MQLSRGLEQGRFCVLSRPSGSFPCERLFAAWVRFLGINHLKSKISNFEEPNLDQKTFTQFIEEKDGIVLPCGATGLENSTAVACLLNHLNQTEEKDVDTLEYPIEYDFIDHQSVFNQSEIGIDTPNFKKALSTLLCQNPGIIIVGIC